MYTIYKLKPLKNSFYSEFKIFKTYKRRRYAIDFVENHKGIWKLIDSKGQEFYYETNNPGNWTMSYKGHYIE